MDGIQLSWLAGLQVFLSYTLTSFFQYWLSTSLSYKSLLWPGLRDSFGNVVFVAVSYTVDGSSHKHEYMELPAVENQGHDVEWLEEGSNAGNFCPDPVKGENEPDNNTDKGEESADHPHQWVSKMVNEAKAADGFYAGH